MFNAYCNAINWEILRAFCCKFICNSKIFNQWLFNSHNKSGCLWTLNIYYLEKLRGLSLRGVMPSSLWVSNQVANLLSWEMVLFSFPRAFTYLYLCSPYDRYMGLQKAFYPPIKFVGGSNPLKANRHNSSARLRGTKGRIFLLSEIQLRDVTCERKSVMRVRHATLTSCSCDNRLRLCLFPK